MIIKGGKIFDNVSQFFEGNILIEDEKIAKINSNINVNSDEVIDATDCYVIPGLVDIHFHGCVGYDFCDGNEEAFDAIAQYQAKNGVTSISPATMTLSREELRKIFKCVGQYKNLVGSTIRGITMEGPFVSLAKKGAQNGAYIHKPDVDFYREMQDLSGGLIRQVAVAPEEDEDLKFTKEISKETIISVAHTTAGFDIADAAFKAGALHVTHMYNAMPAFLHRDPGVVGAAFDNKDIYVEMICDGVHIHPAMVRSMFKMFGPDRICMISDSMMATGLTDGDYSLGGQAVKVTGKKATLEDGTIAGSASNLHDCMKVAVLEMGIPFEQAVLACTATPAKSLGLDKECGILEEGRIADIVILDKELNIKTVIKNGNVVII